MATPYSSDLRARVLGLYARGMPTKQIATLLKVSPAWARRVKQRWREHGQTRSRPMGGVRVIKIDRQRLMEFVRAQPDATLTELRDRLGVKCAVSSLCVALKKMAITFKKRSSTPRSRIVRMWPRGAKPGVSGSGGLMPAVSSLSMKRGPRQT